MTDDRSKKVEAIYNGALELPAEARDAFLKGECGNDDALLREVRALIKHYEAAGDDFLQSPIDSDAIKHPTEIGPYRIKDVIGEGGMGVVYLAEQKKPIQRTVALKVIKLGMDTKEVLTRFHTEQQMLAIMDHPNIARVFDAGAIDEGRPYFAMEYVPGIPVTEYCDEHKLTTKERVRLFMQVTDAVHYAHQKGVIHRDIKPSNVIVATIDGRPVPKVIDFGVAKATEQNAFAMSTFTKYGQLIGTPEYMSPEQAALADIDTRTDVYSLGLLLYELLVGTLPFDARELRAKGIEAMMYVIRQEEPPRPSTRITTQGDAAAGVAAKRRTEPQSLVRTIRGDLDWIVMRALEKERDRRYTSAAAFSEDLQRHLQNEPVIARPPSAAYRMRKFTRRHKVGVGFAALIAASLVTIAIVMSVQAGRIARERDRADLEANTSSQVADYLVQMFHRGTFTQAFPENYTVKEALDSGSKDIYSDADLSPASRVRLLRIIGGVYTNLGRYDEGQPLLEQSLEQAHHVFGSDHLETAESMKALATLQLGMGQILSVRDLMQDAVAIYERHLDRDDPTLLDARWTLGSALNRVTSFDGAIAQFQQALEGYERVYGPESGKVSFMLNSLGVCYAELERYDESIATLERAVAIQQKVYGPERPITWITASTQAEVYVRMGEPDSALVIYQGARRAFETAYGPKHATIATAITGLGQAAEAQDRYDDAESHFRDAVAMYIDLFGEENSGERVKAMVGLARVHLVRGEFEAADRIVAQAVDINVKELGIEGISTISSLGELGAIKIKLGDMAAADSLLTLALDNGHRTLAVDHFVMVIIKAHRGEFLLRQARYEEAEPFLLFAYENKARRNPYPNQPSIGNMLVELYEGWGKPNLADKYRSDVE